MYLLKNSRSLSFYLRFLVLLFSLIIFSNSLANHLFLDNNNLICSNSNCNIKVKDSQKLKFSKDRRVVELLEETKGGEEKILSYLFYTTDITNLVAYSGKPLEILISLKLNGFISDLKLIKHSEPILLTGIPIEKLLEAVCFYKGKNINNKINIGDNSGDSASIPIIAGATVTSLILHETILNTSREIGCLFEILKISDFSEDVVNSVFKKLSWNELLNLGAVKHFCLNSSSNELNETGGDKFLVDIYIADLSHPSVGRNLLGESYYREFIEDIGEKKSAVIILNNGQWSFKGSGFVRGGIFDRFRIEQEDNVFTFRDSDFKNLYDLDLIDIDNFKETGIFIISNSKYKSWKPWNLVLLLNYKTFYINYSIPVSFYVKSDPGWLKLWKSKLLFINLFLTLWFFVVLIFILRNFLSKKNFFLSLIYNFVLILSIYIIGFLFEGQPSIVNIFALIGGTFEIFLFDPSLFLGWIMIFFTIFLWGKSLFCGWICPFGALQEVLFKIKNIFFYKFNFEVPILIVEKIRYIRYIIFIFLIMVSFKSLAYAEFFSEIEPFKTIWVIGILNRSFLISLYTVLILILSFLIYRIFCRFICPLGAFLSLLSFFIVFKIQRRNTCLVCNVCRNACNSSAIDKHGVIDSKECFGCFTCINNMNSYEKCPPVMNRKFRVKYEENIW